MKDERKKITKLAKEIIQLEQQCQLGNNISENVRKIEQLTASLSIEELLELDMIITENILTKK